MLTIHFLGKSRIEYKGKTVNNQLGAKAFALISLLILNENRYLSREKIIGYLWPDSNDDAARYNLRYNLWLIKKSIPPDGDGNAFLYVDKECCAVNQAYSYSSDILDTMNFTPSTNDSIDTLLRLKELFQGDFLEGYYFNKCEEFNELIIFERINFVRRKVKILKRLAELYEGEKKHDVCIETLQEILEIEPYDERLVAKILDIYMLCGTRATAITYYNKFSNELAGNLGIAPSAELREKYNQLRNTINESESLHKINCHIGESPKQGRVIQRQVLEIETQCMGGIPFFWMSSVVEQLIESVEDDVLKLLRQSEIVSLGAIQSTILSFQDVIEEAQFYEQNIKDVAIVNAFIRLLSLVCKNYTLTVHILGSDMMDDASRNVFNYFNKIGNDHLVLIEK